jgi:hypothetical protein
VRASGLFSAHCLVELGLHLVRLQSMRSIAAKSSALAFARRGAVLSAVRLSGPSARSGVPVGRVAQRSFASEVAKPGVFSRLTQGLTSNAEAKQEEQRSE